ncbi:YbaB/EbfC family nucleoid-associated protein [Catenuloplanes atrovinosus]|uniref:DNA-binding protein YbaB n=1 Tax=Catenuloplanes atrovinosus TaxID=137266 RepID=A0AAE3YU37_9ACTN|nr:YbaB/EbfC family nucleoid-associated protein [Catenuloplanes atrovinosus]MDR7279650.1 DNA-binding protein YbaB [Catenuloplanes atrovinosus]
MPREIDEAWVDEAIARYRRIQAAQAEFDRAAAAVAVTVRSSDGSVEVDVTAAGAITDVRILGTLHGRTGRELSEAVTAAVTAATEAARWAREKLRAEVFADYPSLAD